MAPGNFCGNEMPTAATIEDLKALNMWALGMVLFMMINSDAKYPYAMEFKTSKSQESWRQVIKRKLVNGEKSRTRNGIREISCDTDCVFVYFSFR